MTTNSDHIDYEQSFSRLLELFDNVLNPCLSNQLATTFNLREVKNQEDEDWISQLEKLLQRKLTKNERYKVEILENSYSFHGGNEDDKGDSEEEEEE